MVVTIQFLDFLSIIQVIIQLTDHSDIGILLAIWLPDMSDNQMQWLFEDHIFHGPVFQWSDYIQTIWKPDPLVRIFNGFKENGGYLSGF